MHNTDDELKIADLDKPKEASDLSEEELEKVAGGYSLQQDGVGGPSAISPNKITE